ncbi:MAG: Alanine racemase [Nitrospira sp.]|nr:MAG: Alanine racemase [Nitrospira sp.]
MPTISPFSPTYATVDLSALIHNLTQLRGLLSPGCEIMAVVKANAYGHGAVEVSRALIAQGVGRVAVVSIDEGIALRAAGIAVPIVILGPLFPKQVGDLIAHRLTPVISDRSLIPALTQATASLAAPYPIHLKVETGMGRLGLAMDELLALIDSGDLPPSLNIEGLLTHFADSDGLTSEQTEHQLTLFQKTVSGLTARGISIPLIHAANSGGTVRYPRSHYSLIRPGIMLYGYHTLPVSVPAPDLKPVLSLQSSIAQVRAIPTGGTISYNATFVAKRPTRVAVLPIGYADGFNRRLSNRGEVLVQGRRAKVIGTVCMDMVMIDVTDIPDTTVGDEVVLIGRQGADRITAADLAEWTGTIAYETLCAIGARVPRRYRALPEPAASPH